MNLNIWSENLANEHVNNFKNFSDQDKSLLLKELNENYPFEVFKNSFVKLNNALENSQKQSQILNKGTQHYPETVKLPKQLDSVKTIEEFAIVLMAGGEGERLRLSLLESGYNKEDLRDFTKATFPLPQFPEGFGALQTNLLVISTLCNKYNTDIPVIITTGPEGSTTAKLIPKIVEKSKKFGLKNLIIIPQNERLHLSQDKQIVIDKTDAGFSFATNPDETGGPIMKLKEINESGSSPLNWISGLNKSKIMVLQATALYDPSLIETMAKAAENFDGLGIGIERTSFPENDPYGTFVLIEENSVKSLRIIEQAIRNKKTRNLQNEEGKFLPFNTGFYIFDVELLQNCDLPDYATPPKEIHPDLPKAPKVGYAATDIISFAKKPAVLTISQDSFAVIKDASDPEKLAELGKKYGLQKLCENYLKKSEA